MQLNARVLAPTELDEILAFEGARLALIEPDETSRMMAGWQAKWRREALESYLPLGWSFAIRDEQQMLQGYFLAQPLLFFRGQTQTLWVEWMSYTSAEVARELIELAVRWGRDKHLQRVLFADLNEHQDQFGVWPVSAIGDAIGEVKTTKG
jgi:hypothetical protein